MRTVLSPAWTTDWMTDDGQRKLRGVRHRAAGPAQPAPARARSRSPAVRALPAVRLGRHPGDQPVRLDRVQGAVTLQRLPGAVRLLQGALMDRAHHASAGGRRRACSTRCASAAVDRLTDDAVAITFDVPAELRDEYRFTPGQHVRSGCDARRRRRPPQLLDLRARRAAGRLRIGVKRFPAACSPATPRPAAGRRHARGDDPDGPLHHPARPGERQVLRGDRGRAAASRPILSHPGHRARGRAAAATATLIYGNRTASDHHVPRGAART